MMLENRKSWEYYVMIDILQSAEQRAKCSKDPFNISSELCCTAILVYTQYIRSHNVKYKPQHKKPSSKV